MAIDESGFDPDDPRPTLRLTTEGVRRLPMLGLAVGFAAVATLLAFVEEGAFATAVVMLLWLSVVVIVATILPAANTLILTPQGFRIRTLGVFSRFVPWSDVVAIDTGDGWAEATVIVELAETADRGTILGLPRDPTLGRRTFADHYGLDPQVLARAMECRRQAAAHP